MLGMVQRAQRLAPGVFIVVGIERFQLFEVRSREIFHKVVPLARRVALAEWNTACQYRT